MADSMRVFVGLLILTINLCALGPPSHGTAPTTTAAERNKQQPAAVELPDARTSDHVREQYGRLPLSFERNEGQTDPRVEFIARGTGYTMFLTRGAEAVLNLHGPQEDGNAVVRLSLVGRDTAARARGRDELPGKVNYLFTSDQRQWRTGIPTFAGVVYDNIYPGIDVVYYGNQRELEYDFVVRPGADPRAIAIAVAGADAFSIDARGDLVMSVGGREVRQRKPVVYQAVAGSRKAIEGRYRIDPDHRVRVDIDAYDPTLPLVIDPVLVYSTYLGGAISRRGIDNARDVTIDAHGNAYVTGSTVSSDFPSTSGFNASTGFKDDSVFVTKLNAAGTALVYSTLLGGNGSETGNGIAVDPAGNAYLTGFTQSADFPVTAGAFDTSLSGTLNDTDAFVTKLDGSGTTLLYSTFLGGNEPPVPAQTEQGVAIAVDAQGHAYVTGITGRDFPVTDSAFDRIASDKHNGFVAKIDPAGATLLYSTFLGGSDLDHVRAIAVDAGGSAYVAGLTQSVDFPTTPGAFDTDNAGGGFITKLHPAGTSLQYSTFLDGATINGIAVDASNNAYVTGAAVARLPTTPGAFDDTLNGSQDAFVAKITADGAMLAYATFLGGDTANAIAVTTAGMAYVTGTDFSGDVPVTPGAFRTSVSGNSDAFIAALDSLGASLIYATYLGGSGPDEAAGIVVDAGGAAFVAGSTSSSNFPTTAGAFDTAVADRDAFVAKISVDGSALHYSTYLGGTLVVGGDDHGVAIAVDATGSAYVAGSTPSIDFPTTLGAFDETRDFVAVDFQIVFVTKLDPTGATPIYSTYLGPGEAHGIAVDAIGHAYVSGSTFSSTYPTTPGAFDERVSHIDAFVTKLNRWGTGLIYSTVLGGWQREIANGIAVDAHGNAYVAGLTDSSWAFKVENFPTTPGAFDTLDFTTSSAHVPNAFVTKFSADGSRLIYSTLLGGSGPDFAQGIAVDAVGLAYVTGLTASTDFPTTPGAFDRDLGGADAFVTKLNVDGSALTYSTFLGGSSEDAGWSIAVDAAGQAYVVGFTHSDDFPATANGIDPEWNGNYDAFVTALDITGGALMYSSYIGGSSADFAYGVALESGGGASLTGMTLSADFPVTDNALDRTLDGSSDAFVVSVGAAGSMLEHSGYLGGGGDDVGLGIAVDQLGGVYVTGATASTDFPTTAGAFDTTHNISQDAFVAKITGDSVRPALSLVPPTATSTVGEQHCVTATVRAAAGGPLPGQVVRLATAGVSNAAGGLVTDANGQGEFCYTAIKAGTDLIFAYVDSNRNGVRDVGESTRAVTHLYTVTDPQSVTLLPSGETKTVGDIHCVVATVEDRFRNPIPGMPLLFFVQEAMVTDGTGTTGPDGRAMFCYGPLALPGSTIISAYVDIDGDGIPETDEPSTSVRAFWQIPASSACGSVNGYGVVLVNGQWADFVVTIDLPLGQTPGGFVYRVPAAGIYFSSANILSVVITDNHAALHGVNVLDGVELPFRIDVADGPFDTFRIIWHGYAPPVAPVAWGQVVVTTCN